MNRKQRRAMEARAKKGNNAEETLATQAALFSKLPEECTACEAPFDKTDKEMVSTWRVVVREQDKETPSEIIAPVAGAQPKRFLTTSSKAYQTSKNNENRPNI